LLRRPRANELPPVAAVAAAALRAARDAAVDQRHDTLVKGTMLVFPPCSLIARE